MKTPIPSLSVETRGSIASAQVTIFADDFVGRTGDIHGTTPDVTTGGATWTAGPNCDGDGKDFHRIGN